MTGIYQQTLQAAMQVGLMRGRPGQEGGTIMQELDVALVHTAPPPSSTLPMMLRTPSHRDQRQVGTCPQWSSWRPS